MDPHRLIFTLPGLLYLPLTWIYAAPLMRLFYSRNPLRFLILPANMLSAFSSLALSIALFRHLLGMYPAVSELAGGLLLLYFASKYLPAWEARALAINQARIPPFRPPGGSSRYSRY